MQNDIIVKLFFHACVIMSIQVRNVHLHKKLYWKFHKIRVEDSATTSYQLHIHTFIVAIFGHIISINYWFLQFFLLFLLRSLLYFHSEFSLNWIGIPRNELKNKKICRISLWNQNKMRVIYEMLKQFFRHLVLSTWNGGAAACYADIDWIPPIKFAFR